MAYKLVRSHTLNLTAANREPTDSPCSITFELPNDTIFLDDATSQRMKVSLLTFALNADWTEINSTNNSVHFTIGGATVSITIPSGNYPFYNLAQYITRSQATIVCAYDAPSNKFVFTNNSSSSMSIHFPNESYNVLGFSAIDNGASGTTIVSTQPIVPRQNTELYVKLANVVLGAENMNLDNIAGGTLQPSNLLSVIPITSAPFQHMFYDNALYGTAVGVYITNEKLYNLTIEIVDKYGDYADWLPDWTATVLVQIYDMEDPDLDRMNETLASINSTLMKMLTLKVIK